MSSKRVLISGGGIAGIGLAHFLAVRGHEPVVVERAQSFVPKGQFMTVKGTGVDILEAMGIHDRLKALEWPATALEIYSSGGALLRRTEDTAIDEMLDGFLKVLRADLHQALYDLVRDRVDIRFGRTAAAEDHGDHVAIHFDDGTTDRFDLFIAADGVHSQARTTHFPDVGREPLGGHYIVSVVPGGEDVDVTRTVYGDGSSTSVIPLGADARGQQRTGIHAYLDDKRPPAPEGNEPSAWRTYLLAELADHPSWVLDVVDGLHDDCDIFADAIVLIPATELARGNIALLGDAGACPTFLSGMGAAAALLSAYSVAGMLDRHDRAADALAGYEQQMLPLLQQYQASARASRDRNFARGAAAQDRDRLVAEAPAHLMAAASRHFYQSEIRLTDLG